MPLPVSSWEEVRTQTCRGAGRVVNKAGIGGNGVAREARLARLQPELGEMSDRILLPEGTKTPNAWPSDF